MKVGLFGTGAYGIALASVLESNNIDVTMWTKFEEEKNNLVKNRENEQLIPNFKLSDKIKVTTDIEECAQNKELLIIAIPAAFVDSLCKELANYFDKEQHICIASKGIEQNTGLFIHEIVEKYIKTDHISVISGPSFAKDVVQKMPIGLTLATKNSDTKRVVSKALSNKYIKFDYTDDVIGTEICGSIKNIIAIASGMLDGLGGNTSTSAMFITQALYDMAEVIDVFGGDRNTILSFAGFGDLLLTCTSTNSRNFTFGKLIGEGMEKDKIEEYIKNTTIEGYYTLESIYQLLKDKKVKIPIISLIYDIIKRETKPNELLDFLVESV